ncbi:MAG: AAA family ATPase, partial [Clostridiales bacterium]|nr:AAA family ATPase [Clostridiales bacterium]
YLQSCLIHVAIVCNQKLNQAQQHLLASLTNTNPYTITDMEEVSAEILDAAEKFLNSPPILLQLVGMRDIQENKTLGGLFFDAILNILLVMVYLGTATAAIYMKCLQEYCKNASIFIRNSKNAATNVDDKYLFKKICFQDLMSTTESLEEAGEDFIKYKEEVLFYREPKQQSENARLQSRKSMPEKESEDILKDTTKDSNSIKIMEQVKETNQKNRLEELLQELNDLIGLEDVKTEIRSLVNLIKVKKLREKYCLPGMEMSYHMVFSGNPGTGKTTVARLVAEIYKELGLLSKGELVETDRSGLVAGYVGQTALKVKEVVEKAIGGVLFIDEAYSLTSQSGANDFGMEAVDTLVKLMEDHRDDLVVIVAGYTDEMKQFLSANTGLISRFNKFIEFKDYNNDELIDILHCMAKRSGFEVAKEAITVVRDYLEGMEPKTRLSFGNARGIRNLFEKLVVQQANRIVTYEAPTKEQLSMIERDDVELLIQPVNNVL